MEEIRRKIAMKFNEFEDIFIVDSILLNFCKNVRASRCKICKEEEFPSPDYGYCVSKKVFYGYKSYNIIYLSEVVQNFDISPASIHDINFLKDIREQMSNYILIGDKYYLSTEVQIENSDNQ